MSFGAPAPDHLQPDHFAFTPENEARADVIIARYPEGEQGSAIIPLLDLAQRQHGNWLPKAAMDHVADRLGVPRIRAYEVASFYTMFNKAPVGRHLVQICTTTPCWLCGSDEVKRAVKEKTGAGPGETSADGLFTVIEVECLGACVNAPMVQVNDDYFEDLDHERTSALIEALKEGRPVPVGSQVGRKGSQALAGPTTMRDWQQAEPRRGSAAAAASTGEMPPAAPAPKVEAAGPSGSAAVPKEQAGAAAPKEQAGEEAGPTEPAATKPAAGGAARKRTGGRARKPAKRDGAKE